MNNLVQYQQIQTIDQVKNSQRQKLNKIKIGVVHKKNDPLYVRIRKECLTHSMQVRKCILVYQIAEGLGYFEEKWGDITDTTHEKPVAECGGFWQSFTSSQERELYQIWSVPDGEDQW